MIKADSALSQREVCVSKINQIEGIPMGVLCYMWHALRREVLPAFRGCSALEIVVRKTRRGGRSILYMHVNSYEYLDYS